MTNKAKVEGSICNAYLVEEDTSFCCYYFEDHVSTRHTQVPHNNDSRIESDEGEEREGNLSIFKYHGRSFGKAKSRFQSEKEYEDARSYILLNCSKVEPFTRLVTLIFLVALYTFSFYSTSLIFSIGLVF